MALATFAAEIPAQANPFLGWFSLGRDAAVAVAALLDRSARMAAAVAAVVWSTPANRSAAWAANAGAFRPRSCAACRGDGHRFFGYAGGVASNIKVNRLVRSTRIERLEVCPQWATAASAWARHSWCGID